MKLSRSTLFFSLGTLLCGSIGGWWIGVATQRRPAKDASAVSAPRPIAASEVWRDVVESKDALVDVPQLAERVQRTPMVELRGQIEALDAVFWKRNPNAGLFARYAWKRLYADAPLAGVAAANTLFSRLVLDENLGDLFQSMVEGAFTALPPPIDETARAVSTLAPWQARIAITAYLDRVPSKSLVETKAMLRRLVPKWSEEEIVQFAHQQFLRHPGSARELAYAFFAGGDSRNVSALSAAFAEYATLHPEAALQTVEEVARRSPRQAGELALHSRLPYRQFLALTDRLDAEGRGLFFLQIFSGWHQEIVWRLPRIMAQIPFSKLPESNAQDALATGIEWFPKEVQAWLQSLPQEAQIAALDRAMAKKMGPDPESAFTQAENYLRFRVPMGDAQLSALLPFLEKVARDNPAKAQELASSFPESMRAAAQSAVVAASVLSAGDLDQFFDRLQGANPEARTRALASIGERFGPEKILERLENPEERHQFCSDVLEKRARFLNGEQLATLGTELLKRDPNSEEAQKLVAAAVRLSVAEDYKFVPTKDPEHAAELVSLLPPGKPREESVVALASYWINAKPTEATNWIRQFPAGKDRDLANSSLITAAADDLPFAFETSRNIEDSKVRDQALQSLAAAWAKVNPAKFAQLAAEAGLSTEEVARLQKPAAPPAIPPSP